MLLKKPVSDSTDQELLHLYKQSREAEVVGYLFTRYTSLVYGVCLKYLKNREEAQDATMNIFEKLLTILLNHEVTHFKSWLFVTTRNHCLMHLRAQTGKQTEELSPLIMESSHAAHLDDEPDWEGNLVKLENCIGKLIDEQQRCVRLFFLQQKCYQEISTETNYTLKQVKSYLQNGKRNLKICMDRND